MQAALLGRLLLLAPIAAWSQQRDSAARPAGHEITPTNDQHDLTGSDGQSPKGSSLGGK